jgi:hypothetical protein
MSAASTAKDAKSDSTLTKAAITLFSGAAIAFLYNMKGNVWFSWHFVSMIVGFVLLPGKVLWLICLMAFFVVH